jgi:hypothetical protein
MKMVKDQIVNKGRAVGSQDVRLTKIICTAILFHEQPTPAGREAASCFHSLGGQRGWRVEQELRSRETSPEVEVLQAAEEVRGQ